MRELIGCVLIMCGEAIAIFSQAYISRFGISWSTLWAACLGIFVAGVMLLAGYRITYTAVKSIWTVSIFSLSSIAVLEPMIMWFMFKEVPSWRHVVGFILGITAQLVVML